MPKKKVAIGEEQPNEEVTTETLPASLPLDAHTYYVWKDGTFIKLFSNEPYKGEALKYAQLYADEIGGTVQI